MILVDTSVWIDHLRATEPLLVRLLTDVAVCMHPMVVGEVALGSLRNRAEVLASMDRLPPTPIATAGEVRTLVESHVLYGAGLSLVDVHLLAALRLSMTDKLWTRDRRLRSAAERLRVAADVAV